LSPLTFGNFGVYLLVFSLYFLFPFLFPSIFIDISVSVFKLAVLSPEHQRGQIGQQLVRVQLSVKERKVKLKVNGILSFTEKY